MGVVREYEIDERLKSLCSDCEEIVRELNDLRERLRNVRQRRLDGGEEVVGGYYEQMRWDFTVRFVHSSAAVEGNRFTLGETRTFLEKNITIGGRTFREHTEIRNLKEAVDWLFEVASERVKITASLIRQMHQLVMKDIEGGEAGVYRRGPVRIAGAEFEPPDAIFIHDEMEALEKWFEQQEPCLNPLLAAAIGHAHLVRIHPFSDGNGRVARLLVNFILLRRHWPPIWLPDEERVRYYEACAAADKGDISPLVELFSERLRCSVEQWSRLLTEAWNAERFAKQAADALQDAVLKDLRRNYELEYPAYEMVLSSFRKVADSVNARLSAKVAGIRIHSYQGINFAQYAAIVQEGKAPLTWYFVLECFVGKQVLKRLFWFGHAPTSRRAPYKVALLISVPNDKGSHPWRKPRPDDRPALRYITLNKEGNLVWVEEGGRKNSWGSVEGATRFLREILALAGMHLEEECE